jgi:parallel beta-helix repeat protein
MGETDMTTATWRRWFRSTTKPASRSRHSACRTKARTALRLEELENRWLPSTFTVTNTADSGAGSLRQAILDSNAHNGSDQIRFNIPGSGVHTINLVSALPVITDTVALDGTTQPGYKGSPLIELNGAGTPILTAGLVLNGANDSVRGLVINRFSDAGIVVQGRGGDVVQDNYIGTDATGTQALGNGHQGIAVIQSPNNRIDTNLVSGNGNNGIALWGSGADSNRVERNYLGTDVTGKKALPNAFAGVAVSDGSNFDVPIPGMATRTLIQNNLISGNGFDGVNIVGSFAAGAVDPSVTFGTRVLYNRIGETGNGPLGSSVIFGSNGVQPLPNGRNGVNVAYGASGNTIMQNTIAYNTGNGVRVGHTATDYAVQNVISANSIHDNVQLGIDLGGDGVTDDASNSLGRTGPNNWQRYPDAITAQEFPLGGLTFILNVKGSFLATKTGNYTIELFTNPSLDPTGFGEGAQFIGSIPLLVTSIPADNRINFDLRNGQAGAFFFPFLGNPALTCTLTGPDGTSEFSPRIPTSISPFLTHSTGSNASLVAALTAAPTDPASSTVATPAVTTSGVTDGKASQQAPALVAEALPQESSRTDTMLAQDQLFVGWDGTSTFWQESDEVSQA